MYLDNEAQKLLDNWDRTEQEKAAERYGEAFRDELDRIVDEQLELVDEESPTGAWCLTCGMPATRYQAPLMGLVWPGIGLWRHPILLCGVCSERSLLRAHQLAETDVPFEEWRAHLESPWGMGEAGKSGPLDEDALKRALPAQQASLLQVCSQERCSNEWEAVVSRPIYRGQQEVRHSLVLACDEHLGPILETAMAEWEDTESRRPNQQEWEDVGLGVALPVLPASMGALLFVEGVLAAMAVGLVIGAMVGGATGIIAPQIRRDYNEPFVARDLETLSSAYSARAEIAYHM